MNQETVGENCNVRRRKNGAEKYQISVMCHQPWCLVLYGGRKLTEKPCGVGCEPSGC